MSDPTEPDRASSDGTNRPGGIQGDAREEAAKDAPIEFEKISIEEAQELIDSRLRPGSAKSADGGRPPARQEALTDDALTWLATLPSSVRPVALARGFPRIANRITTLWQRPAQCDTYLKELLIDNRGGRKGFPREVAEELIALAAHYATLYPYKHSIWNDIMRK